MSRQPHANSRSQPTSGVGNLSGRRGQVETDGIRSASSSSGTQQAQSRGPPSTLQNEQPLRLRAAAQNATGALKRRPKRPRRRIIQSTTYNDIRTEPDTQAPRETIRLNDYSSDEYQNSHRSDQTESDTEPDMEDNDIPDATGAGLRHRSLIADGRTTLACRLCVCWPPPDHRRQHSLGGYQQLEGLWYQTWKTMIFQMLLEQACVIGH